ncbi:unnamed protein product [Moneuplotes crassus]|uniref:Uncharacterized protein n=1 Tax=Euplotes crassus TaxID=5936 RepID=A0AAD1UL73_EUPCR|nr:unnamed protein product [Moneuplotes crassus]
METIQEEPIKKSLIFEPEPFKIQKARPKSSSLPILLKNKNFRKRIIICQPSLGNFLQSYAPKANFKRSNNVHMKTPKLKTHKSTLLKSLDKKANVAKLKKVPRRASIRRNLTRGASESSVTTEDRSNIRSLKKAKFFNNLKKLSDMSKNKINEWDEVLKRCNIEPKKPNTAQPGMRQKQRLDLQNPLYTKTNGKKKNKITTHIENNRKMVSKHIKEINQHSNELILTRHSDLYSSCLCPYKYQARKSV